jgi:hypothetical protein
MLRATAMLCMYAIELSACVIERLRACAWPAVVDCEVSSTAGGQGLVTRCLHMVMLRYDLVIGKLRLQSCFIYNGPCSPAHRVVGARSFCNAWLASQQ